MSRPGLVLTADERTPPIVAPAGAGVALLRPAVGSRVVYPPDPLPVIGDPMRAVAAALSQPLGRPPLRALLRPGMRLTVSVETADAPWPAPGAPDPRSRVVEAVLTSAADAGVDDVVVLIAGGMGRRLLPREICDLLGERVSRSLLPLGRVVQHDPDDPEALVNSSGSDANAPLELNARAAESDLLVRVSAVGSAAGAGPGGLPRSLGSTATIRACADPAAAAASGAAALDPVPTFSVELVLSQRSAGAGSDPLDSREWEWSARDQLALRLRRGSARLPAAVRQGLVPAAVGGRDLVAVAAGDPDQVGAATRVTLDAQRLVAVPGPADVVVLGIPGVGPDNRGAPLNPVLAASLALDTLLGSHTGVPVVRPGGVAVLLHPLTPAFSGTQHPAHADFFSEILPLEPGAAGWDQARARYAGDPWFRHLYLSSHAYPGIHPFVLWERTAAMRNHLGDIIWVGADRRSAGRVGGRAATTVADALEIAAATVGPDPSVVMLHSAGRLRTESR